MKSTVRVALSNRWAAVVCPVEKRAAFAKHFRYRPLNWEFRTGFQNGGDGYVHFFAKNRVPAGLFLAKRSELEKEFDLKVEDLRELPSFSRFTLKIKLRPYQVACLDAMLAASLTGGLILNATGTGKTVVAAAYFQCMSGRCLFVLDDLGLLDQTHRAFESLLGEKIGIVGKSVFAPEQVTVATVQTLDRHLKDKKCREWLETVSAVVVDEFHVMVNKRSARVAAAIRPLALFGMTGTAELDLEHVSFPMHALAGPVVFDYPIARGVAEGYLTRGVICKLRFSNPTLGTSPGYRKKEKKKVVDVPSGTPLANYRHWIVRNLERNEMLAAIAREAVRRKRWTILLVERREHLAILSDLLADVVHVPLSGANSKTKERRLAVQAMNAGELPLILTTRIFTKGVDVEAADLIVDATASPGRNSALQRYGRGTRVRTGKTAFWYVNVHDAGGKFSRSAKARTEALRETGSPFVDWRWNKNASAMFDALEKA